LNRNGKASFGALLIAILALAVAFGAGSATAAAPKVTIKTVESVGYSRANVSGTVDPEDNETTWSFEASSDGGATWSGFAYQGAVPAGSGSTEVKGELTNLIPGTEYEVRLVAQNFIDPEVISAETNPTLVTKALPEPLVTINPVADQTATTATFSGSVDPNPPAGDPDDSTVFWQFECEPECPGYSGNVPASAASPAEQAVKAEVVGLKVNTHYKVKLIGQNANRVPISSSTVEFDTGAISPAVTTLPAFSFVGGTRAVIGGKVNAENQSTDYWLEYGTSGAYGTKVPATEDGEAGEGETPELHTAALAGLQPETTYHFRIVAKNGAGTSNGDDTVLTTPVADDGTGRFELPDGRVWEQVSPVDKNGSDVYKGGAVAAVNGNAITWKSQGSFAEQPTSQGGKTADYRSVREGTKWVTKGIVPGKVLLGFEYGYRAFDANLTKGFYNGDFAGSYTLDPSVPVEEMPASETSEDQSRVIDYWRDFSTGAFHNVSGSVLPGNFAHAGYEGSTPDMSHIYISSWRELVPGSPCKSTVVNDIFASGPMCLYDYTGGTLHLASILPGEVKSPGHFAGVSDDGSQLFFTNEGLAYRRTDDSSTVTVGASERTTPPAFPGGTTQVAAIDHASGDRALLRSTVELVDEDEDEAPDLYLWDGTKPAGLQLTLIRGDAKTGDGENEVLTAANDLSRFFFRTSKQILDGAPNEEGSKNYLWENGAITYIGAGEYGNVRKNPDASFIAFISSSRVSVYDNAGHGEAYRYDAASREISCVSCNPTGEAATADAGFDPGFDGLLPVHELRNVSEDGKVFFMTGETLVPRDTNGTTDVYEYTLHKPYLISQGTAPDASLFFDASPNGDDVFFNTVGRLVKWDRDESKDLYDARVDGGLPEPPPGIIGCEGDSCVAPPNPPNDPTPASANFNGTGNVKESFKKPKHKKKHHKKKHHKKKKHNAKGGRS
jgi:hypothetical protein